MTFAQQIYKFASNQRSEHDRRVVGDMCEEAGYLVMAELYRDYPQEGPMPEGMGSDPRFDGLIVDLFRLECDTYEGPSELQDLARGFEKRMSLFSSEKESDASR